MKKLKYRFTKPGIYLRYKIITRKKLERLERVKKAIRCLRMFWDVPYEWQVANVCQILRINNNQQVHKFINALSLPNIDPVEMAKMLPLE